MKKIFLEACAPLLNICTRLPPYSMPRFYGLPSNLIACIKETPIRNHAYSKELHGGM